MNPQSDLTQRLGKLIATYAPHDGGFDLPVEGLKVVRVSHTNTDGFCTVSSAGVCLVAQGCKQVTLGDQVYSYDRSKMVLYSMTVPIQARIVQAQPTEPFLSLALDIQPQKIAELALQVFPHGIPRTPDVRAIHLSHSDDAIIEAALRLFETLKHPRQVELLAPRIIEEIWLRIMLSPLGPSLAQIGTAESPTMKIVESITWLRNNYQESFSIEQLSSLVNMSESSFHRHFKSVTSMSPLQFQKVLRLQEARNSMLYQMHDVTTASTRVGYLSPSQFTREYTRYFGMPPSKDIARHRASV